MPIAHAKAPALSVLIVNFNSTVLLRECLRSVAESTIADQIETIVVDNASDDFDVERLRAAYPWAQWLPQTTNTTYTGGNNRAFEQSSADLVLLLNPDTRVEAETLERAIAHMSDSRDLAALGAYLVGSGGELQRYYRLLPTFGDLPVMLFGRLLRSTRRARQYQMQDETFELETAVPQPPGAFLLCRRRAVGANLLDDGYFNFVSDLELCDRLQRAGRVSVFSDVRCHHVRAGAGVGTADPVARLRLYHDYTWGLRRYFGPRLNWWRRALLNLMLITYWILRIGRVAVVYPRLLPHGIRVAIAALRGRSPQY